MEKQEALHTLKELKKNSDKRNFKQSIELIINLVGVDLKKQENQITIFASLPFGWGKKVSVGAFVAAELTPQAKEICNETIISDDFRKYADKRLIKKLVEKHDFFIAQANIMPQVAATFGRVLGPRGKMPNPKLGSVLPPNGNVKAIYDKLQKTKKLSTGKNPIVQCSVGSEDAKEEEVVENIMAVYNAVLHALPQEKHNIKSVYLKMTMSKALLIEKIENESEEAKGRKHKKALTKDATELEKEQAKETEEK